MQQAASHTEDVNNQIQSQLRTLMGRLDALAPAWTGASAASFQQLRMRWNENAEKLNAALVDIAQAIRQSGQQYGASDEAAQSGFNNITGALG